VVAGEQLAAADAHHRDARVVAVARVADHVAVAALELEHHRRLLHALEVAEGVAKLARALEIEPLGGLLHARRDAAHHLVGLAVEEDGDLVDHRPVVVERLVADARGLAALDREVEAGALGHLARHVVVARPHREDALDDVQRLAHPPDVGVRTEVARPVALEAARDEHARVGLLDGDLDVRVVLVVLERDVEARPVLLDEVRFEDQRVRLGGTTIVSRSRTLRTRPRVFGLAGWSLAK
jgi:hypothetical protein